MTGDIAPFVRVIEDEQATATPPDPRVPRTLRLMRAHFALVGVALFVLALALLGSLYNVFDNVSIERDLGLSSIRDLYETSTQITLLRVLIAVGISLLFFHAAALVAKRQRGAVLWGRAAALLLLAGLPAGVNVWRSVDDLDQSGSQLLVTLSEFPWVVYGVALLLIGQVVLALWYQIWLFLRPAHAYMRSQRSPFVLARLAVIASILIFCTALIPALMLGVLTDWLYEIPVADAEPGEVLYATSFDDYIDDWDIFLGADEAHIRSVGELELLVENEQTPALSGNALVITVGSGPVVIPSQLDRVYRDFDLRVTAQQVNGPYDQNLYGVIFRYRDDENYYLFRITSDAYYALVKVHDGVPEVISAWSTSDAIRMSTGNPEVPRSIRHRANTIRVVGDGDRFRFFVNGVAVPLCLRGDNNESMWNAPGNCNTSETTFVYEDDAFHQGRIALFAGSLDGSEIVVAFDDLIIVGPDPDEFATHL